MPRSQGVRISVGLGGTQCGSVRCAVGGPVHGSLGGPERIGRAGRVPERGAKLTGAGCA